MAKLTQEDYIAIGARIREARLRKGMSQQELSAAADLSLPQISVVEHGKNRLRLDTFVSIASALDTSADELLGMDVPAVVVKYRTEIDELLADSSARETESILKIIKEIKSTLRMKDGESDE